MKNPFARDLPLNAAIVIVALVLVASVVTGREAPPQPAVPSTPNTATATTPIALAEIDVARLERQRGEREVQDIFAERIRSRAVAEPVAVAPPQTPEARPEPPPAPTAPPLPFSYLGRMLNGDSVLVYLLRNQEMVLAQAGDTLDGTYRLDSISDTAVHFTYLPLGTQQALSVPAQP